MSAPASPALTAWGARLFRARGWIPVPLALVLVGCARPPDPAALVAGALLQGGGLALRLWAVAHIGPGSRRRTADVGALALSGPYRRTRNPLYLGNLLCWASLACWSGWPVALPLVLAPLILHYSLIIRWEESRLTASLGDPYLEWSRHTPRWLPSARPTGASREGDWRTALRSERSTHAVSLVLAAAVLGAGWFRASTG